MFAHAEGVESCLFGDDGFFDNVPQDLCLRAKLAAGVNGDIAKGVESEFERLRRGHPFTVVEQITEKEVSTAD